MKALKCKPSAQFAYNYTINVLSKCSNIISHRSSVFEADTMAIDLRRSAHRSSIFHLSSILEGRHIDRRSSKVDTSVFEDRRRKHRTNILTIRHRILSTTALHSYRFRMVHITLDEGTHTHTRLYGNSPTRALIMYYTPICIAYCASRRGN